MAQVVLGAASFGALDNTTSVYHAPLEKTNICWNSPWNIQQARFEPCFVPAIAALPAIIAAALVFWKALRLAIPWRPRWTLPFSTDGPDPLSHSIAFLRQQRPT
jgi:hypothetical protein